MSGSDTFSHKTSTLSGLYLWGTVANWNHGLPTNGADVIASATGYDNISSLDLQSLDLIDSSSVWVTASAFAVTTLMAGSDESFGADAKLLGAPVTVTVNAITGTGADYVANGEGALFIDNSATETGNTFVVENGGTAELKSRPTTNTSFEYGSGIDNTIALENPGATVDSFILNFAPGDVLELPGNSVRSVTFGSDAFLVVTNVGSYNINDVQYLAGQELRTYVAKLDPKTGLEAITFGDVDTFSANTAVTSGPLMGEYAWSTAGNSSLGAPPVNGDSVVFDDNESVISYDDISSLFLDTLNFGSGGPIDVVGGALTVSDLAGSGVLNAYTVLEGAPVTVTVGTMTGTEVLLDADGPGATLIYKSAIVGGAGDFLEVGDNGLLELFADTSSGGGSISYFGAGGATIAFEFALPEEYSTPIEDVLPGDTLEVPLLPGASVASIDFTTSGMQIVFTNQGPLTLSSVTYDETGFDSYVTSFDAKTGLEAIPLASPTILRRPSNRLAARWEENTSGARP